MNALVIALPGLVIIFVLAGGVNALAGVLVKNDLQHWNNTLNFLPVSYNIDTVALEHQ